MPIQIINSAVKYAPEPNTSSIVVCRTEGGVVCRVLNNPPSRYRTKNISQQAVANAPDGVDGNSKVGGVVDRHTDGLESEGGQASSPYDMTSVFGLKVHRLNAEEIAAEEQSKRKSKGSAAQTPGQPETDGGTENEPTTPGPEQEDVAETVPAELWMRRPGASTHKRLPAHTALTDRVRDGNTLVKRLRAGRSLREATLGSVKGALELGLWAASRPDDFIKGNQAFQHHEKPSTGRSITSQGQAAPIKAGLPGESGADDASATSGAGLGPGSVRDNDRVTALEAKLLFMDERFKLGPRKPSGGVAGSSGGRESKRGRNDTSSVTSSHLGHRAVVSGASTVPVTAAAQHGGGGGGGVSRGGSVGSREGGGGGGDGGLTSMPAVTTPPAVGGESVVPRIVGLGAKRTSGARRGAKRHPSPLDDQGKGAGMEGVGGEGKVGIRKRGPSSTGKGSLTSRSSPATTGGFRSRRVQKDSRTGVIASGSMSARRPTSGPPVAVSALAKKELKAAVKAYVLRQVGLDNALSDSIRQRDFDWDADMRRMMDTIKIAAAGEGKRTFESVPKVMRRQVVEKRRADEARSLQGSWFPSVMRRMVIMTQGKDGGEIPQCVTKLAAALHKVLVSGHTVTPSMFWSFVNASFLPEDHQRPCPQKMILACLPPVHQRPENYHGFLVDNSIKVPSSLKKGFHRAHQKRAHRKGGPKKPHPGGGGGGGGSVGGGVGKLDSQRGSTFSLLMTPGGGGHGGSSVGGNFTDCGSDDMSVSDTMSVFSVATHLGGMGEAA